MGREQGKTDAETILEKMVRIKRLNMFSLFTDTLSQSEFMLLRLTQYLEQKETPPSTAMLGAQLGISKPAVSQMVNSLEDKGFIQRYISKNDRRLSFVTVTEQGENELKHIYNGMNRVGAEVLAQMGRNDLQTLLTLLDKLYQAVAAYKEKEADLPGKTE